MQILYPNAAGPEGPQPRLETRSAVALKESEATTPSCLMICFLIPRFRGSKVPKHWLTREIPEASIVTPSALLLLQPSALRASSRYENGLLENPSPQFLGEKKKIQPN